MRFRDLTVRIIAAGMASAIMMSVASCSLKDFRAKIINEPLSAQELTRRIVSVINDKDNAADVYASIPEEQRDGVSYSYFIQYVDIMSQISGANGDKITSFRMLSSDEVFEITEEQDDSYYGSLIGFEFLYDAESNTPTYLVLSQDDKGITYLSEEWITDSILIYNYVEHYFMMLNDENIEGIYTLLRPGLDSELYTDSAVTNEAQKYVDYYKFCVRSSRSQYQILTFNPDHVQIRIPETVNYTGSRVVPHTVDVVLEEGSYSIIDTLPDEPDLDLLVISDGNRVDLRCGEVYNDSTLLGMLGEPTGVLYYDNRETLSLNYSGLILIFDSDDYSEDGSWSGVLTTIRVSSGSVYRLGQGIHIGMEKPELIELYPFIDTETFEFSIRDGSSYYTVSLEFDDHDRINFIRIVKD